MKLPLRFLLSLLALAACAPGSRAELRRDVEYGQAGGDRLFLDVNVPDGDGPFPVAILVHGGGWSGGDKAGSDKPGNGADITPWFAPLTAAKFTWFSINYRLAPAHRWPACLDDVKTAIRWVKAHAAEYKADPKRIAIIGESAGGHLVSLAGGRATADTRVAAVVPFYAPHDLELQVNHRHALGPSMEALFGLTELNDAAWKVLREASPITYVHKGLPPYLLIHGTKDTTVPFEQSLKFQEKMKAAGNVCDLIAVEGGIHGMGGWEKIDPSYKEKLIAWLHKTLVAKP